MKKIIVFLILAVMGVNLFASSGFGFNTNSKVSTNFSSPLEMSYGIDYSYGLLGNETKQVWVDMGPSGGKMLLLVFGPIFSGIGLGSVVLNKALDLDEKGMYIAGGVIGGLGLTMLIVGLCLPDDGYYKTVEVVNNDVFNSEIYLTSNIATTSVGYKMNFK